MLKKLGAIKDMIHLNGTNLRRLHLVKLSIEQKKAGFLEEVMAKQLQSFREDIRNPYSHYNIRKITKDVIAGKVKKVTLSTGEIDEIDIPAKESPMIQAQVKPWVDQQRVLAVFHFADAVVKHLVNKLDAYLQSMSKPKTIT